MQFPAHTLAAVRRRTSAADYAARALDVMREGPCKECPWFHICAAMDEKVEG